MKKNVNISASSMEMLWIEYDLKKKSIHQGHITLIESDIKDVYIVTKISISSKGCSEEITTKIM